MSQKKDRETSGSLGYQKKNNEEVEEIVKRLNTPKKKNTPKDPDRRREVCVNLFVCVPYVLSILQNRAVLYTLLLFEIKI